MGCFVRFVHLGWKKINSKLKKIKKKKKKNVIHSARKNTQKLFEKNSTVFTCPLKILLKKPSRCGEIVAKFPPPPFAYTTRIKTIQNYKKKNLSVKILLCESLSYCSCCSLQLHLYECLNKVKKAEKHIDLMGIMIKK